MTSLVVDFAPHQEGGIRQHKLVITTCTPDLSKLGVLKFNSISFYSRYILVAFCQFF